MWLAALAPGGAGAPRCLTYQVAALSAAEGRGSGRTTGRMWVWRPVRFRADMVLSSGLAAVSV